jgi:hypothetical protein
MVLDYKATDALNAPADPLEIHAANVVSENVGQSHGSINAYGNITAYLTIMICKVRGANGSEVTTQSP